MKSDIFEFWFDPALVWNHDFLHLRQPKYYETISGVFFLRNCNYIQVFLIINVCFKPCTCFFYRFIQKSIPRAQSIWGFCLSTQRCCFQYCAEYLFKINRWNNISRTLLLFTMPRFDKKTSYLISCKASRNISIVLLKLVLIQGFIPDGNDKFLYLKRCETGRSSLDRRTNPD